MLPPVCGCLGKLTAMSVGEKHAKSTQAFVRSLTSNETAYKKLLNG
jgi:hypothetical protein